MDRQPNLEDNPASPAGTQPRFPGEDGGLSLAEMAERDLDAALQLLTERAQYVTGATGAAIAMRKGQQTDMLCRATAGSHAPELGAVVSTESGLLGESVRTRQGLRCDDAFNDAGVNRQGCRLLGIASVAVMPIVDGNSVLGVFQLFSDKPHAFDDRDLSALARLSEMVGRAVKHSVTARTALVDDDLPRPETRASLDGIMASPDPATTAAESVCASAPIAPVLPSKVGEKSELAESIPSPIPKAPPFWFAPVRTSATVEEVQQASLPIAIPPTLRNYQKCEACGFPVSQGRTLCVECEEKQWRGQRGY
jgi:GAF domain